VTLLEDWQQKSTWHNCYTPVQAYMSRKTGFTDLSLREVLRREDSWTFDKQEPSGFNEVAVVPAMIPGKNVSRPVIVKDTIEGICEDLLRIFKITLENLWDTKIPHVVFISGGRDSRILMFVLRQLLREGKDLGEFILINHEPEQDQFRAAIKDMDFPLQYCHVRKENALDQPDYYDISPISHNVNAFCGPEIIMHQDYYPEGKACLVTGAFGGELLDYSTYRGHRINWGRFLQYTGAPRTHYSELYANWKDILMPYSAFDYLNYVFQIPQKFFVKTGHGNINGGDLLRDTMLKMLGNTAPFYYKHAYNMQLSAGTKDRIQQEYSNSKFVEYFHEIEAIMVARPAINIFRKWEMDSKLYGLATVIEGLPENKVICVETKQAWAIKAEQQKFAKMEADRLKRLAQFKELDAKKIPSEEHHYSD